MNFEEASGIEVNGSSYRGVVNTTYEKLVTVFGPPHEGPHDRTLDKITCEWRLRFEDGDIATIYDWKETDTPMGEYEWHVGGFRSTALEKVTRALESLKGD